MNARCLTSLVAATLFSVSAYAHDCSGGADGGMDATGNQCNDPVAAVVSSDSATSTSPSLSETKVYRPTSRSQQAHARTIATRHHLPHAQIKHS